MDEPPPFSLSVEAVEADLHLVVITGELDLATAPALADRLTALTAERGRRVLIDLSALTFVDSTGVRILVAAARAAERAGGAVVFAVPPGRVARTLDLMEIAEVVVIERSQAAALAHLDTVDVDAGG